LWSFKQRKSESKNPSKNRNNGIKKSNGEFIAFINAHSLVEKDWLSQTALFFKKNPKIDIVGGPQLTSKNERTVALK
jgi:cellulose synthase/poly-beta-1,6-N-acetylglucosamine synthase-like glycosyltransferase